MMIPVIRGPSLAAGAFFAFAAITFSPPSSGVVYVSASQVFEDGGTHLVSAENLIDGPVELKSSTTLTLGPGSYDIRGGDGVNDGSSGEAAATATIRLTMGSTLNATGGVVYGRDNGGDAAVPVMASAGVHVGGASRAEFYAGVVVRGGNADSDFGSDLRVQQQQQQQQQRQRQQQQQQGGDALQAEYFGSAISTFGGTFVAGRGSSSHEAHSLAVSQESRADVYGGTFSGSWLASNRGAIVAHGCLTRAGDRLVGTLSDGSPLDVRVEEIGGGAVVVMDDGSCKGGGGGGGGDGGGGHHPSAAVLVWGGKIAILSVALGASFVWMAV